MQHVDVMQQQVIDAEINVEAMNAYVAIIQQQMPAPPAVGPVPPEEQQGQSGLDEESQTGPPPPLSPVSSAASDGSVGN